MSVLVLGYSLMAVTSTNGRKLTGLLTSPLFSTRPGRDSVDGSLLVCLLENPRFRDVKDANSKTRTYKDILLNRAMSCRVVFVSSEPRSWSRSRDSTLLY